MYVEIGLRRAVGASRAAVQWHVVGEVMVMAGFAVTVGLILVAQMPAIAAFSYLSGSVIVGAAVLAAVTMIGLAGLCGCYPGWTTTRIRPAEALHHE